MTRDEAREFLQSLESFANDQIVESEIQSDVDLVIALGVKTESAERERCAMVAIEEKVDADETGEESDFAYNRACDDIAAKILSKDRGSDPPQAKS